MTKEKILIVDDEETIRSLFQDVLQEEGYQTQAIDSASKALELLTEERFDLIITDLKMPGMGGLELIQQIKERYDDIVVIVMTGFATLETARAVTKQGAYDYIIKPCNVNELKESVDNALARYRLEREKNRTKELMSLFRISEALSSTIKLDVLLDLILTLVLKQTHAQRGSLLILDKDNSLTVASSHNENSTHHTHNTPKVGQDIVSWVASTGNPVLTTSIQHHPLLLKISLGPSPLPQDTTAPSIQYEGITIPIKTKNNIMGVLTVYREESPELFTEADLEVLTILGTQAAISIENARLYNELETKIQELKTTNKQLQEAQYQLIRAGRLATVGELAGGIAHEIGNPLFAISGILEMLLERSSREGFSEKVIEYLTTCQKQIERVRAISNNMLKFARSSTMDYKPVSINETISEVTEIIHFHLNKNNIQIAIDFDPSAPTVLGDNQQLQQVFLNLLLNAKDAMPEGGRLAIKTRQKPETDTIEVSIQDTGSGIPENVIEKIFDPFFTTKKVGKGTGLGLSVSYGIIQQHKGDISVTSQQGTGTTFYIDLPLYTKALKARRQRQKEVS